MKIILFDPPVRRSLARYDDVVNTPLSSCLLAGYAAASLQAAGFEVDLVVRQKLPPLFDRPLIALHLVYQWEYTPSLLKRLGRLKEENRIAHLFVFGFYPSAFFERLLEEYPFLDGVIVGDPEETLLQLVNRLTRHEEWRGTEGVAFREAGQTCLVPRPDEKDLDRLPFPRRTGLSRGTAYLLGSRGCYGQCRFCTIHFLSRGRSHWRGRSPENIVDEMVQVRKDWDARYFYFADPNFCGPGKKGRERVARLAHLIRMRLPGVTFGMECRADNVEEALFAELTAAGLRDVFLGVESFSQRMLDRFRKGLTVEQNIRAVEILQRFGINLSLGFIMFEKESTLDDVRTNFDTLRRLDLLTHPSNTAHLLSHRVFLFQGTAFSPLGKAKDYEAPYVFDEEEVRILYDTIYSRCRRVMREMDGADYEDPGHPRYRKTNQSLIGYFEAALARREEAKQGPLLKDEVSCEG